MSQHDTFGLNFNAGQQNSQSFHRHSEPIINYGRYSMHRPSDLDLSQYHYMASAAQELPMQDLTKPEDETPFHIQHRNVTPQLHLMPSRWVSNDTARRSGPRTEPIALQAYGGKFPGKASDVSDSAYESMPASGGPFETYNENGNELTKHCFSADGQGNNTMDVAISPKRPRSTKSEGQYLPRNNNTRRKQYVGPCLVPGCTKQPKNQSDAKKHALTHQKPHRCVEPECSRKDGFATINDLERHKKSVHGLRPLVGSPAGYICAACPPHEAAPRKFWPRRDNFKAHIKRKHPNCNEEQLLEMSKQAVRPDDTQTIYGGSAYSVAMRSARQSQIDTLEGNTYQQTSQTLDHAMDHNDHMFPDPAIGAQNDELLLFTGDHTNDSQMFPSSQYNISTTISLGLDALDVRPSYIGSSVDDRHHCTSPNNVDTPACKRSKHTHQELAFTESQFAYSQLTPAVDEPSFAAMVSESQPPNAFSTTQGELRCPQCPKTTKRECDLKKHLKRHTRPYGCTFDSCYKGFGSRNDWKRHESSQHCLTPRYKCNFYSPTEGNSICPYGPVTSIDMLKQHLSTSHQIRSQAELEQNLNNYKKGLHAHENFWCGFCRKLIEQPKLVPVNAWDTRLKHIGDHYDKERRNIGDWFCLKENRMKKDVAMPKHVARNAKKGCGKTEEDLPDVGQGMVATFRSVTYMPDNKSNRLQLDADAEGESDDEYR